MKLVQLRGIEQVLKDLATTQICMKNLGANGVKITLFDSVGFAIEYFAALRYVRAKLTETSLFTQLT